jgi:FAD/FMN-containing dehydrogenase
VSSTYVFEQSRYWSAQQASVNSACRVTPSSANDVSATILVLNVSKCKFAVKSGGHAAFKGASNIDGGVTIDLINLNGITVNAAKTVTSVGTGNTWYDVYSKLDPQGISVVGGRVAAIGTGGLPLGGMNFRDHSFSQMTNDSIGGISFFSGRYGWACDNVVNYEVCIARINKRSPF